MTGLRAKEAVGSGARAGTQALTLLSIPINVLILDALADRPRPLAELRREAGSPPPTTLRGYLRLLLETGAIERHRQNSFPGNLDYELTAVGRDLIAVTRMVARWLALAPDGPLEPGTSAARMAVKSIVDAWGTNMTRALAARPLALTELDSVIADVSYPSLERRLTSMRLSGQVRKIRARGRGTPYAVTDWLRHSVAPLAAAVRWEREHQRDLTPPVARRDVEGAFLLAIPLLELAPDLSGSCRLVVELPGSNGDRLAGVMVKVEEGAIASCVSRLEGHSDAWASGSPLSWIGALMDRDPQHLELNGDCRLAQALVDGLHDALFTGKRIATG